MSGDTTFNTTDFISQSIFAEGSTVDHGMEIAVDDEDCILVAGYSYGQSLDLDMVILFHQD